jgi:hypothetical protein
LYTVGILCPNFLRRRTVLSQKMSDQLSNQLHRLHRNASSCRSECLIEDLMDLSLDYADASRTAAVELLHGLRDLDDALVHRTLSTKSP